jgi:DNA-binding transcriptional ArsR family regulator
VLDLPVKPKELDLDLDFIPEIEMELEMEMDLDIRIPLVVVLDKALPAMTKIVYGVLRSFCSVRSTICAPSVIELGKRTGIEAPNVIPHLGRLRRAKYIKIDRPGRRNRYTFLK